MSASRTPRLTGVAFGTPENWIDMRAAWQILKRSVSCFFGDNAMQLSAALAFYAALSLAPIAFFLAHLAGRLLGESASNAEISRQASDLFGDKAADLIVAVVRAAYEDDRHGAAAAIGIVTLLVGATGVFAELQEAMNKIWSVKVRPRKAIFAFVRNRLLSLMMLAVVGVLMLVWLILTTMVNVAIDSAKGIWPDSSMLSRPLNTVASVLIFMLLFTVILKVLPDAKVPWLDALLGAVLTSLLFAVGKELIGLYITRLGPGSAYGAAGSLIAVLVWVYYSSIILFFGAEFTHAFGQWRGERLQPEEYAVEDRHADAEAA